MNSQTTTPQTTTGLKSISGRIDTHDNTLTSLNLAITDIAKRVSDIEQSITNLINN